MKIITIKVPDDTMAGSITILTPDSSRAYPALHMQVRCFDVQGVDSDTLDFESMEHVVEGQ